MRRQAAVAAVSLAVAAVAGCSGASSGGSAACASPVATASPTEVAPGGKVTVSVDGLLGDCYDTGQGKPNPPLRHAAVVLRYASGSRSDVLATVDADATLHAAFTLTVPTDAPAGPATVVIDTMPFDLLTIVG